MRNKVIILMILVIPMAVFAFLQATTKDNAAVATVSGENIGKGRIIKFYSPMCSECKTVGENISNVIKDYNDIISYEEINVSNKDRKTKNMIQEYKVTVVPTVIFIGKDGKITHKNEGGIEEIEIRSKLDEIK